MHSTTRRTPMSRLRAVTLAASTALALSFAAGAVNAKPGGGMHGGHGGGGFEQMIPHMLERAKPSLNLNTMQQGMWDSVVENGKTARQTARSNMQQVKAALQAQLANPAPDLASVAAVGDQAQAQNAALRKGVRDQWLQLYATFSPEQKAVVRDLLQKHVERAEAFRAKMGERGGHHGNPATN